jgi:hypothetical protein
MDAGDRSAKLAKLVEIGGYDSADELLEAVFSDAVSPAICMREGYDFTCEMEPDQDAGYCEECHTNTMKAAPVLAGIVSATKPCCGSRSRIYHIWQVRLPTRGGPLT